MRTPWIWTVSLGRWWNVHVRLHMFFCLFAAFAVYLTSYPFDSPNWLGIGCVAALFVSVLLHEIGHVVIARRMGGIADDIVIGPLGGLSAVRVPYEPQSELVALMAGTLVNIALCFVTALALAIIQSQDADLIAMLRPSVSYLGSTQELTTVAVLKLVFWVNWSLILVNLIPAFPFDGGRSLHAVLAFLWPEVPARQALVAVCRLGRVLAVVGLLLACFYFAPGEPVVVPPTGAPVDGIQSPNVPQPPIWFVLSLLSIYVFFSARREELQQTELDRDEDTVFGYDFSQGYTSLERSLEDDTESRIDTEPPPLGMISRWLENRRQAQQQRQQDQEFEDEKHVDEILDRLHKHGMRSLSPEDKALLNRVSKRYRSRQG